MKASMKGKAAIEALAARFPQLYIAPAEGTEETHRLARVSGITPENANLDHFTTSENDELRDIPTPAGSVETLFLENRRDFETFLQIIGHKSKPVPIARTIGAITYRGLVDWGAVADARAAYLAGGGDDWRSEFARLAEIPGAFRAELIVISEGPYSGVLAENTPYGEAEWLRVSREIRLHHECAHIVCRRTMPDDILPVWDEITADVVGLLCAIGRYDTALAFQFLGVTEAGFTEGRLAEYLDDDLGSRIDEVAIEVAEAINWIEALSRTTDATDPFEFLLALKRAPMLPY